MSLHSRASAIYLHFEALLSQKGINYFEGNESPVARSMTPLTSIQFSFCSVVAWKLNLIAISITSVLLVVLWDEAKLVFIASQQHIQSSSFSLLDINSKCSKVSFSLNFIIRMFDMVLSLLRAVAELPKCFPIDFISSLHACVSGWINERDNNFPGCNQIKFKCHVLFASSIARNVLALLPCWHCRRLWVLILLPRKDDQLWWVWLQGEAPLEVIRRHQQKKVLPRLTNVTGRSWNFTHKVFDFSLMLLF